MSLSNVFDLAGSGMRAQTIRLNTTASNLANADNVAGSPEEVYRARHPVFAAALMNAGLDQAFGGAGSRSLSDIPFFDSQTPAGVQVLNIAESDAPALKRYQPDHPMADDEGYTYSSNVNAVEEMVDMLSAARSYQNNIEMLNTTKELLMGTLRIGQ